MKFNFFYYWNYLKKFIWCQIQILQLFYEIGEIFYVKLQIDLILNYNTLLKK